MPLSEENVSDWMRERLGDEDFAEADGFLSDYIEGNRVFREGAQETQSRFEQQINAYKDEIGALKARNYDLLMKSPADDEIEKPSDDGDSPKRISDLFTDAK